MKFQVAIATGKTAKLKTGPAFVSVKFKDGEPATLAGAVAKAVQSNIGKHCTVDVQADLQEGVEAAAIVSDRYGNKTPYRVTVTAA